MDIKGVKLTVDVPLVSGLPITQVDAKNYFHDECPEEILAHINTNKEPFRVLQKDTEIRQKLYRDVRCLLNGYGRCDDFYFDMLLPEKDTIKTKTVKIPNKESELYNMDVIMGVLMMQFNRWKHDNVESYEESFKWFIWNDPLRTYIEYMYQLPSPIEYEVPYIPKGTIIGFNKTVSFEDYASDMFKYSNDFKRRMKRDLVE